MIAADSARERAFDNIKRLCYAGLDSATLRQRVAERLRDVIPFEGYALIATDPVSGLPTSLVGGPNGIGNKDTVHIFFEHLYFDDANEFGWMARKQLPVAPLSESMVSKLTRSVRHQHLGCPLGVGYELRSAFTTGLEIWGGMCITRENGQPDFDEHEVAFVRNIGPHLGAGLQAAVLQRQAQHQPNGDDPCGVIVLDHHRRVVQYTTFVGHWLDELDGMGDPGSEAEWTEGEDLPTAVWSVVGALHLALKIDAKHERLITPRLCVQGRSGRWLTLQASLTKAGGPAETVVVIAPAGPTEVARLHMSAYGLSVREKEVVEYVVRGYSTRQISAALHISESTIQGHLSHVFEKVGVKSRRELLKRFFLDNLLPKMSG